MLINLCQYKEETADFQHKMTIYSQEAGMGTHSV